MRSEWSSLLINYNAPILLVHYRNRQKKNPRNIRIKLYAKRIRSTRPWRREHCCAIKRSFRSLRISWVFPTFGRSGFSSLSSYSQVFPVTVNKTNWKREAHQSDRCPLSYYRNNRLLIVRYWASHRIKDDDKTMKEINFDRRGPTIMSNFCQVLDPPHFSLYTTFTR
jgi:hypothetical protein